MNSSSVLQHMLSQQHENLQPEMLTANCVLAILLTVADGSAKNTLNRFMASRLADISWKNPYIQIPS